MIISKLDAARIQLDHAIKCFFDNDHVCAVTLGGASEELLGGLLNDQDKQNSFQFLHEYYENTNNLKIKEKEFSREQLNVITNWLKHSDQDPNSQLDIGQEISIFTLMRALASYQILTNRLTLQMQQFFQYVQNNKDKLDELFHQPTTSFISRFI